MATRPRPDQREGRLAAEGDRIPGGVEFSFVLEGSEKLEDLENFFSYEGAVALERSLAIVAKQWFDLAASKVPYATGKLRASLRHRLESPVSAIVYSELSYAPHVHEGAAPHFPPPENLMNWVGRKKRETGKYRRDAAWKIAGAIADGRAGGESNPFLLEAMLEVQGFAMDVIGSYVKEALKVKFES